MPDHITDPNMPADLRALAARIEAGEDPDEIKGVEALWIYRLHRDKDALAESNTRFFEYIRSRQTYVEEIVSIASDLAGLWENPNIQALARSDRNSAIEMTRERMTLAVQRLQEWEREHGNSR